MRPNLAAALAVLSLSTAALAAAPKAPAEDAEGEELPDDPKAAEPEGDTEDLPKPDKTRGVVIGKVRDEETGDEVADAQIVVVGRSDRTSSDYEGRFGVKLPPGTYSVRVFFPGFKTRLVSGVQVKAGAETRLDVALPRDKKAQAVEELVVEVEPDRAKPSAQLLIRRKSAAASDGLGAQDIARTPDRNAAEAARRVVGATIWQDRFVFVRGLGDRYTNSLLNGAPLPSPEPDLQAIPLDIFPVGVLSDIVIVKTFTPDMPADFTGGSVRLGTRQFPEKPLLALTATAGFNTQTTFSRRRTYAGGSKDWQGKDDGTRAMPRELDDAGELSRSGLGQGDLARYGRAVPQGGRRIYDELTPPNSSLSLIAGDKVEVGGHMIGFVGAASYGRRHENRDEFRALYNADKGQLTPKFAYDGRRSNESTSMAALGTLGFELARGHKLSVTAMASRRADDTVLELEGPDQETRVRQRVTSARWVERTMTYAQLVGEHQAGDAVGTEVRWAGFVGKATRGEPNFTESAYEQAADGRFRARDDGGLSHFTSKQAERLYGASLDVTQPLALREANAPKIKAGVWGQWKNRDFAARRFRFELNRCRDCIAAAFLPPDRLTQGSNIGPVLLFEESTLPTDQYDASQRTLATYVMADAPITRRVRVVVGPRLEQGRLSLLSRPPFDSGGAQTIEGGFSTTDVLPSASVIVSATEKSNLRLSATQTVARPQFREVAPFSFSDYFNGERVLGNPQLRRSRITNLDARYEAFPSPDEVLSVSVFYKSFADPIEATVVPTSELARSYENSAGATNVGVELEARKGLGFMAEALSGFTFLGNVSLIRSRIELSEQQKALQTDDARPLQGQSPFVINAALDYRSDAGTTARVSYNVMGRRIAFVGATPQPNIYEQPRHVVDVSVAQSLARHLELKVSVENLLNAPFVFTQDTAETVRFRTGTTAWTTLTLSL